VLKVVKQWYNRNRIQPVKAALAVSRLIKDPDDTGQVFKVLEALRGDSLSRAAARMHADAQGLKLLRDQPNIVSALNDRETLASLPEGSIGRAYYNFVHLEGLSADGLIASSDEAPSVDGMGQTERWLGDRLRDIHDLQHVMTGYGRDPLGELCLLSFMTTQTPSRGIDFIVFVGRKKAQKDNPSLDINGAIDEGRDIGAQSQWMLLSRWEDRLHEPLAAVREELGFRATVKYREILRTVQATRAAEEPIAA
jgi:ubiquinone biosynthesis protein COQ4